MVSLGEVKTCAEWADHRPAIRKVTLFGSRVRGDNRPDSDLDIYIERHTNERQTQLDSLHKEKEAGFPELQRKFPFPLRIIIDCYPGETAGYIAAGRVIPELSIGKVVCVWTKPK